MVWNCCQDLTELHSHCMMGYWSVVISERDALSPEFHSPRNYQVSLEPRAKIDGLGKQRRKNKLIGILNEFILPGAF